MSPHLSNNRKELIQESDFKFEPGKKSINQHNKLKEIFSKYFVTFFTYFLLILLFIKSFIHKDFSFCNLIIFGILINNVIKALNQEAAITMTITIMYLIPKDHTKISTFLLFYLSALFQVFRLKGTRFYIKLRKIRIWGGPIYGCLLFWRILNSFGMVYVDLMALLIFLVGVKFRPNFFEKDYDKNRRIHKYLMISNFCILSMEDIWRVYELLML
jgi:hypothetical protein